MYTHMIGYTYDASEDNCLESDLSFHLYELQELKFKSPGLCSTQCSLLKDLINLSCSFLKKISLDDRRQ